MIMLVGKGGTDDVPKRGRSPRAAFRGERERGALGSKAFLSHLQPVRRFGQLQPRVVLAGEADAPLVFKEEHVAIAAVLGAA